ncbi:DUF2634 domain-containing protein [Kamptonema sp. UHCC 0994]|uniref:DUF2634 domain-containing protein n=1 Tax=Kamptonema sp. UHCC 0994 TaxID=3031329 RepID=UPI0023B8A0EE|nr:DUF2634 domain-containing protein [Kamptonema sp. UHCC 0994]MDF0551814.1 DUF2634 domain-containing protein [Kamptonema sp. UHCC 0994]
MAEDLQQFDLKLTRRYSGEAIADWQSIDLQDKNRDLTTVTEIDNLNQAILNRLHTRQGELADLGHPDYGSRLYLLVGELNNIKTQGLANIYIRECLQEEPRVEEVIDVSFEPPSRLKEPNTLKAKIMVKVLGLDTVVTVNLSIVAN